MTSSAHRWPWPRSGYTARMLLLAFVLACSPSVALDVENGETAPESGVAGGGGDGATGHSGHDGEDEDPDRIFQLDHTVLAHAEGEFIPEGEAPRCAGARHLRAPASPPCSAP